MANYKKELSAAYAKVNYKTGKIENKAFFVPDSKTKVFADEKAAYVFAEAVKHQLEKFELEKIYTKLSTARGKVEKLRERDSVSKEELSAAYAVEEELEKLSAAYAAETGANTKSEVFALARLYAYGVYGGKRSFSFGRNLCDHIRTAYTTRKDADYKQVEADLLYIGNICRDCLPAGIILPIPKFALRRRDGVKKYTIEELCDVCRRTLKISKSGFISKTTGDASIIQQAIILFLKEAYGLDKEETFLL